MWTEAHRARHEARLKEVVALQAVGPGDKLRLRRGGAVAGTRGLAAQREGDPV